MPESNNIITLDNIKNTLKQETGVAFSNNNFFINKVVDQFMLNLWAMKDKSGKIDVDKQKRSIYALANNVAKFAAARVDFNKDFDKIDVVFRGGIPCLSIRTELMARILSRRGYIYNDFFAAISPDSAARFVEKMSPDGRRVVIFEDDGKIPPEISVDNILSGAINRFAIRISIGQNANNLIDFYTIVPTQEIINAANRSENGFYVIKKEYDEKEKKYKRVITKTVNTDPTAPWIQFTSEMVKKTCVRRLQKVISETFPDLSDVNDLTEDAVFSEPAEENKNIITISSDNEENESEVVDWEHPTPEQAVAINSAYESYKAVPNLMLEHLNDILADFPEPDNEENRKKVKNKIISKHYALLYIFRKTKTLHQKHPELLNTFGWLIN